MDANTSTTSISTPKLQSQQLQQMLNVTRWSNEQVLEWLRRKMPELYEMHKDAFIKHQITGNILERDELEILNNA